MRNTLKKLLALALAVLLCLSLDACYSENNAWAARSGDVTLPIGGYIYYLNSAYVEAMSLVPTDQEVLKTPLEGSTAEDWIKNKAMESLRSFFYVEDQCAQRGLALTADDEDYIDSLTDSNWAYYKDIMESHGISQESFSLAFGRYGLMADKLFAAIYDKGGEQEVPEDELKDYFVENYVRYEYFYAAMSDVDEDGATVDLSDEDKQMRVDQLESYADSVTKGELTLEEAAERYAGNFGGEDAESTYTAPQAARSDELSTTFSTALADMKDDETRAVEGSGYYFVIHKLPVAEGYEDYAADETQRYDLLYLLRGDAFYDDVAAAAAQMDGIEINQKAIDRVKISSLVDDSNRNGTLSTEDGAGTTGTTGSTETASTPESDSSEAPASSAAE